MTKPAYLMTLEEIDRCYPIECAERHRAFRAREHSFAMYDFHGKPIPHPNSKEDLLKIIGERDIYVVDSNSLWKKECLAPENSPKAFIICPALARENPNTEELILNATRSKLGNIFSFGIDASLNCILIDRIDEPFKDVFDQQRLRRASKQKYEHVFGDMHIVQTAIYLKASILTKDKKLEQMANYADIKCYHVPQLANA